MVDPSASPLLRLSGDRDRSSRDLLRPLEVSRGCVGGGQRVECVRVVALAVGDFESEVDGPCLIRQPRIVGRREQPG
jgi:hypothetical protein